MAMEEPTATVIPSTTVAAPMTPFTVSVGEEGLFGAGVDPCWDSLLVLGGTWVGLIVGSFFSPARPGVGCSSESGCAGVDDGGESVVGCCAGVLGFTVDLSETTAP